MAQEPAPASPGGDPRPPEADLEAQLAEGLGIGRYRKHLLLCSGPNCCSAAAGSDAWGYLERRLAQLERQGLLPRQAVYRTRVDCLKICRGGPILVVYPEGVWYRGADPAVCERVIREHLGEGRVVEGQAFAFNPLLAEPEDDPGSGG